MKDAHASTPIRTDELGEGFVQCSALPTRDCSVARNRSSTLSFHHAGMTTGTVDPATRVLRATNLEPCTRVRVRVVEPQRWRRLGRCRWCA